LTFPLSEKRRERELAVKKIRATCLMLF